MKEGYDIIYLEVLDDPPPGYEDDRVWSVDTDFDEHTKYIRYDLYRDLQQKNIKLQRELDNE